MTVPKKTIDCSSAELFFFKAETNRKSEAEVVAWDESRMGFTQGDLLGVRPGNSNST